MIINCKSNEFDDIKTTYESFGYEFVSSEIIATVSNDNFDEKSSGDLTLASRSEQTLSVTFKREKNIPNYEFLVALEKRYNNLTKEYDNLKYKHAAAFSWFIILGVLIFILFLSITIIIGQEGGPFGATMVFIPFGGCFNGNWYCSCSQKIFI